MESLLLQIEQRARQHYHRGTYPLSVPSSRLRQNQIRSTSLSFNNLKWYRGQYPPQNHPSRLTIHSLIYYLMTFGKIYSLPIQLGEPEKSGAGSRLSATTGVATYTCIRHTCIKISSTISVCHTPVWTAFTTRPTVEWHIEILFFFIGPSSN